MWDLRTSSKTQRNKKQPASPVAGLSEWGTRPISHRTTSSSNSLVCLEILGPQPASEHIPNPTRKVDLIMRRRTRSHSHLSHPPFLKGIICLRTIKCTHVKFKCDAF